MFSHDGIEERLTARERAAEAEDSRRPLCSRAAASRWGHLRIIACQSDRTTGHTI